VVSSFSTRHPTTRCWTGVNSTLAAYGLVLGLLFAAVVAAPSHAATDPAYSVAVDTLAAALDCPAAFTHPEHEPVLLVHGTVTSGHEEYAWNWELLLPERGYDFCVVTYPDRGLGDMQVSAEYVAYAVQAIHARTGAKVDMVGHSQGAVMPRWAIKWWPSVQAEVDDFVMLAGPSHGIGLADYADQWPGSFPAVFWQFDPTSKFITALNAGDETPGGIDYSSIYSETDEAVRPVAPVPTAGLDWQHTDAHARNLSVQEVCPGRLVDHLSIGTTDRLTQELVLDALSHPGPVDPSRVTASPVCILPDQYMVPAQFQAALTQLPLSLTGGFPDLHLVPREPDLMPYATQAAPPTGSAQVTGKAPSPAPRAPSVEAARATSAEGTLAATGGQPWAAVALALGLVGMALGLLARRTRID
jgi:triacylglycerol lipase